jgi:predicted ArsR family transcriptional regulator
MGNSSEEEKPRDETHRFTPETSVQEVIQALEKHGEKRVKTSTVADEIDYTSQGAKKRLRRLDDYVEEEDFGQGSTSLWSLRYTRSDFLDTFDALGDLTPTEEIADHLNCSDEVAREWLYKLKDEGEVGTHTRGEDISPLWSKIPE